MHMLLSIVVSLSEESIFDDVAAYIFIEDGLDASKVFSRGNLRIHETLLLVLPRLAHINLFSLNKVLKLADGTLLLPLQVQFSGNEGDRKCTCHTISLNRL